MAATPELYKSILGEKSTMRRIWSVIAITSFLIGNGLARAQTAIMDTDTQYLQSCQPLADQQWRQHQNSYSATKILTVQSGPNYSTAETSTGIKSHDYCIGVAFIHNDGKHYDLTFLRCEVWPDRPAKIDREPCEAPSIKEWNYFKDLAREQLPDLTAAQWVMPYEAGVPASLKAAKEQERAAIFNSMNRARMQGQMQGQMQAPGETPQQACVRHAHDQVSAWMEANSADAGRLPPPAREEFMSNVRQAAQNMLNSYLRACQ